MYTAQTTSPSTTFFPSARLFIYTVHNPELDCFISYQEVFGQDSMPPAAHLATPLSRLSTHPQCSPVANLLEFQ
ncbi:Hypothetical protein CulFRC58_2229 [Corynebacterium ulcerans FRC58]|uniref:Uncharacterized protein n=1 Tax=Corynebacterium ulcerans FRC58 TaxID=1408268 RepID=A0ABN4H3G7_CORUL|nr:Hypothetical protein CulFRC58_2229 [Corynebacterium ulcerans FRC58]